MSSRQKRPQLSCGDQRMAQQKGFQTRPAWSYMSSSSCEGKLIKASPLINLLLLQDSSGLKLWKRRWFVLSNYCLFYYKGTRQYFCFSCALIEHQRICVTSLSVIRQQRGIRAGQHPTPELQDPVLHTARMQEQEVYLQGILPFGYFIWFKANHSRNWHLS